MSDLYGSIADNSTGQLFLVEAATQTFAVFTIPYKAIGRIIFA